MRLQAQSIVTANPSNLLTLNYYYCAANASVCTTNKGNILSQKITVPAVSSPISQTFTYDGVNRLSSGSEPGGWNLFRDSSLRHLLNRVTAKRATQT